MFFFLGYRHLHGVFAAGADELQVRRVDGELVPKPRIWFAAGFWPRKGEFSGLYGLFNWMVLIGCFNGWWLDDEWMIMGREDDLLDGLWRTYWMFMDVCLCSCFLLWCGLWMFMMLYDSFLIFIMRILSTRFRTRCCIDGWWMFIMTDISNYLSQGLRIWLMGFIAIGIIKKINMKQPYCMVPNMWFHPRRGVFNINGRRD